MLPDWGLGLHDTSRAGAQSLRRSVSIQCLNPWHFDVTRGKGIVRARVWNLRFAGDSRGRARRQLLLAMQKVEGSNPFSRSPEAPHLRGFSRSWTGPRDARLGNFRRLLSLFIVCRGPARPPAQAWPSMSPHTRAETATRACRDIRPSLPSSEPATNRRSRSDAAVTRSPTLTTRLAVSAPRRSKRTHSLDFGAMEASNQEASGQGARY
jgi:hypothetical protein